MHKFSFFLPNIQKLKRKNKVKHLIKALKHEIVGIRCAAVDALGEIGGRDAQKALLEAFGDTEPSVGDKAVDAIINNFDAYVYQRLILKLSNCSLQVRKYAVKVLTKIGSPTIVKPLILALKDHEIRKEIIHALGEIGDSRAVEPLLSYLDDKDQTISNEAVLY